MYARRVADRELTFDFAAGLVNDNLLIVDRETRSVWSQLHGRAIAGPLEGEPLRAVPSLQTTWAHWRRLHPATEVMVVPDNPQGREYVYRAWMPGEPRPEKPPRRHDTSRLGLGLSLGGEAIFFPFTELEKVPKRRRPVELELGGGKVEIHFKPRWLTAWAEDAEGNLLPAVLAYEKGWMSFNPGARRFDASAPE